MRRRKHLIALSMAAILVAGAAALHAADGLPRISGDYGAKVKIKAYGMDTDDGILRERVAVQIRYTQIGSDLTMVVTTPEGSFTMTGLIGNGHFWVSGTSDDGHTTIATGHVKSKGKRLTGTMIEPYDDGVAEIKINAKRAN